MSNLTLVFVCLALGLILQRVKSFPKDAAGALNAYVIYIALPALVLDAIPKLAFDQRMLIPVLIAWTVMIFSAGLTLLGARWLGWSRSVTGAMMLVIPLGNTSFIGFPLIEAHLGSQAIPYAILYDQFGSFLALNTYGIVIAGFYAQNSGKNKHIGLNIVTFPPFIALFLAVALRFTGYPQWLGDALPRLASTLVPVVMVAVGLQWRLQLQRDHVKPLALGLVCVLLLQPLFALGLTGLFGIKGIVADTVILEAAMPSMISAGVLATANQLAPRLASAMVGYSLVFGLFTVWAWHWLITYFPG